MNLRAAIEAELTTSRQIIRRGEPVASQFEIYTPTGQFNVTIVPSSDDNLIAQRFGIARDFMILKAATGFTLAGEIVKPKALSVAAVISGH